MQDAEVGTEEAKFSKGYAATPAAGGLVRRQLPCHVCAMVQGCARHGIPDDFVLIR